MCELLLWAATAVIVSTLGVEIGSTTLRRQGSNVPWRRVFFCCAVVAFVYAFGR